MRVLQSAHSDALAGERAPVTELKVILFFF
jgi:hypothetical protein